MKKVLLHICCAPCAITIRKKLENQDFEPIGYFYNPNIQPKAEYQKRLKALKKYANSNNLKYFAGKYQPQEYFKKIKSPKKPQRCIECYQLRLAKTAQKAAKNKIRYFTTTLLASPYQDLVKIKEISQKLAQKYDLKFITDNFHKNFHQGHRQARQMGMYLQRYCGCIYSLKERQKALKK